eukprot:TRINITY_DN64188_c0_g1_i1.p1 TRINITY_DN64188_c0_g1~~TRINITY_DN64188_c0_g1_i1.p1  ORF type:complete len:357 (+),score=21.41 TRINITY_DN64188_c0_g1_i1:89-1159(+)
MGVEYSLCSQNPAYVEDESDAEAVSQRQEPLEASDAASCVSVSSETRLPAPTRAGVRQLACCRCCCDTFEEPSDSEPEDVTLGQAGAPIQAHLDGLDLTFQDEAGCITRRRTNVAKSRVRLPESGNMNRPGDYVWLEEALAALAQNKGSFLRCADTATSMSFTPLFFMVGACPNTFCGMQAVMFCVGADGCINFWWVKPRVDARCKLDHATLNLHRSGPCKNDPGRSRAFLEPLAKLFCAGRPVNGWQFGIEMASFGTGAIAPRAFLQPEHVDVHVQHRLYLHLIWQEDWTSNPFSRSRFIRGKLVYQKCLCSSEYFSRQFEIVDEKLAISCDEEPLSMRGVLPDSQIKTLWRFND